MTKKRTTILALCAAAVLLSGGVAVSAEKAGGKKSRLFILSGQSNMVGLKEKLSFIPAIEKAFPGDEIVVVKSSRGGQPIRRWYKKWKAPQGARADTRTPGELYDKLMTALTERVAERSYDSFDSVTFVWMQGERDAKENLSAVYAASMAGLIEQLRTDIKRPDMTVVIGRLSDHLNGKPHWDGVRAAQVKVAEDDPLVTTVDTDAFNGPKNGLHYNKEGYQGMGERFAEEAIKLIRGGGTGGKCPLPAGAKKLVKDDTIVFLGDSITAAGVRPTGYVTLTAKAIAKAYPTLNVKCIGAGISGHKVPDCQKRLDRDVIQKKPTIVLIYIGINDVWHWNRNRGTKKEDFEAGLHDMIKKINAAGARVILCTPTVIGEKTDGTNHFDKMLDEYADISRKVANATGSQLLDLRKAFMTYLKANNPDNAPRGILTGDTVHLNNKGNSFLAGLVLDALGVPAVKD